MTPQLWNQMRQRVALRRSPESILSWLLGQGVNELDARRALQYQLERA